MLELDTFSLQFFKLANSISLFNETSEVRKLLA